MQIEREKREGIRPRSWSSSSDSSTTSTCDQPDSSLPVSPLPPTSPRPAVDQTPNKESTHIASVIKEPTVPEHSVIADGPHSDPPRDESQHPEKSLAAKISETSVKDECGDADDDNVRQTRLAEVTPEAVNETKPEKPQKKLIIADVPRSWSLSGESNSPPSIATAPQMWHQIPDGPFVEEDTDR